MPRKKLSPEAKERRAARRARRALVQQAYTLLCRTDPHRTKSSVGPRPRTQSRHAYRAWKKATKKARQLDTRHTD